jgi:hypothetical protein
MFSVSDTTKGLGLPTIALTLQSQHTHRQQHLSACVFYPKAHRTARLKLHHFKGINPAPAECCKLLSPVSNYQYCRILDSSTAWKLEDL